MGLLDDAKGHVRSPGIIDADLQTLIILNKRRDYCNRVLPFIVHISEK